MATARTPPPEDDTVNLLARELWETHATHHQAVIPFPQEHWDQLDPFTQDHWRHIARTALAFRPGPDA